MKLSEIRIRDPFVLPVAEERRYYLYGTTDGRTWAGPGVGFDGYRSADLVTWQGPLPVFRRPPGFWGDRNFWAPEVYSRRDGYVMLASFKSGSRRRGVQCLVADDPCGPFLPRGEVLTPSDWECLDGTLYLAEEDAPWLVFCREWVQVHDGEIWAVPLSPDLTSSTGAPELLIRSSEAPWTRPVQERHQFVTDGPFLHRTVAGSLLMIWSSFGSGGYCVGLASSRSGSILGPWRHRRRPLFPRDGGHGMLFRAFEGDLRLALHTPNRTPDERALIVPVSETAGGGLKIRRGRWYYRILRLIEATS